MQGDCIEVLIFLLSCKVTVGSCGIFSVACDLQCMVSDTPLLTGG